MIRVETSQCSLQVKSCCSEYYRGELLLFGGFVNPQETVIINVDSGECDKSLVLLAAAICQRVRQSN